MRFDSILQHSKMHSNILTSYFSVPILTLVRYYLDASSRERPIRQQFWHLMECVECPECVTSLVTKVTRQSDDMIVQYLWNAENVKNIWHVTSSWRHQSIKKGQFLHICKFFSPIHVYFTWNHRLLWKLIYLKSHATV